MSQNFSCDNNTSDHAAALVGFLYQDCEPGERAAIAAHLAVCARCTEELAGLSEARQQLSTWTPPETQLDFRLTSSRSAVAAAAPAAGWRARSMPAWAQLAAALAIFVSGAVAGVLLASRGSMNQAQNGDTTSTQAAEIARMEQRLRSVEQRPATVTIDEATRDALVASVTSEIRASERRQAEMTQYAATEARLLREAVESQTLVSQGGFRFGTTTATARSVGD